ncbi:MAG: hypothetical protein IJ356_08070 [Erysipelotrichaceae bacterium]|nr:hypothetical protein [Erysipelotrichaceae bacterium]
MEEVKRLTKDEIEKLYEHYLDVLKEYLVLQNLSKKTIDRTLHRACDFLYGYLNYNEPLDIHQGVNEISYFFSYHAPYKFWANAAKTREYGTAVKKLYLAMNNAGIVSAEELNLVLESIQDELDVLRYQKKEGEER